MSPKAPSWGCQRMCGNGLKDNSWKRGIFLPPSGSMGKCWIRDGNLHRDAEKPSGSSLLLIRCPLSCPWCCVPEPLVPTAFPTSDLLLGLYSMGFSRAGLRFQ